MPIRSKRCAERTARWDGGRSWAQKSLVIAQAAMSLVLLSAAALLGQSLRNLEHQDFGFETKGGILRGSIRRSATTSRSRWSNCSGRSTTGCGQIPGVRMVRAGALCADDAAIAGTTAFASRAGRSRAAKEDTAAAGCGSCPASSRPSAQTIADGPVHLPRTTRRRRGTSRWSTKPLSGGFSKNRTRSASISARTRFNIPLFRNRRRRQGHPLHDLGLQGKPARPMFWVSETQSVITTSRRNRRARCGRTIFTTS